MLTAPNQTVQVRGEGTEQRIYLDFVYLLLSQLQAHFTLRIYLGNAQVLLT